MAVPSLRDGGIFLTRLRCLPYAMAASSLHDGGVSLYAMAVSSVRNGGVFPDAMVVSSRTQWLHLPYAMTVSSLHDDGVFPDVMTVSSLRDGASDITRAVRFHVLALLNRWWPWKYCTKEGASIKAGHAELPWAPGSSSDEAAAILQFPHRAAIGQRAPAHPGERSCCYAHVSGACHQLRGDQWVQTRQKPSVIPVQSPLGI